MWCQNHPTLPPVKEGALHLHGVVSDKHVPLDLELKNGGWAHRPNHHHQERFTAGQLQATRDIHQLHIGGCVFMSTHSNN